ncbi:putative prenylcysteine lyase [Venturia nashicola]|uniref:Putative prenylcysteine lyase n=1 Tax=Venturia nashicola TaxID=86259 RepID=A0A4Z1NG86_9PEZI|nr:putative prenylcysteine lyase [Venturia nashicola]TLD20240.1 putative prenylcysteine lyase [Venturia nashicola]
MRLAPSLLFLSGSVRTISANNHHTPLDPYDASINSAPPAAVKRVAIIGAGAGGASTAYHLSQYAKSSNLSLDLTVYERNPYIGGRSTTVHAYNNTTFAKNTPVELGASIFVKINHILYDASDVFNLTRVQLGQAGGDDEEPKSGPVLGVFDGDIFVFTQEAGTSWWKELAKLWWRYGLAPLKARNLMKEVTGNFQKMYEAPYFPFASLTDTLYNLGLLEVTNMTGAQYLKEKGVGELFSREIVQASTRVNYAQNLGLIHGVEAMVCLAAEGAMAIRGGNWRIFESMIDHSAKSVHLSTEVTDIMRHDGGTFTLTTRDARNTQAAGPRNTEEFDTIILAAPYQFASINISPESNHIPEKIPYVNLHVTLFTSPHILSPGAFKLKDTEVVPSVVLTTLLEGEDPGTKPIGYAGKAGFFSISTLRRVTNPQTEEKEYLYKIFSPHEIDGAFLAKILGLPTLKSEEEKPSEKDVTWIHRKLWQSYPYELPRSSFEEVRLDENLWYTSGIESFISTMETSSLMGANVAKLIVDEWLVKDGDDVGAGRGSESGGMTGFREETQVPLELKAKL